MSIREHSRANQRLPVLLASLGIGILLIASGFATRFKQNQDIEVAVAATQTASVTDTPTPTATLTSTPTNTPTITLTPTNTPTGTLPPTATPTLTLTASPTPVPARTVAINTGGYATPIHTPGTAIPTPVNSVSVPSGVINVVLLGSDKRPDDPGYRTDTMIIVSINTKENTVNMLSVPRDLLVYAPGWTMTKINTVYQHGEAYGWPGGGFGLLKEMLLYNFGIVVHHYAFIDLSGFKGVVDTLGGVEVPVDCAIEGWVLKEPRREPEDFDTWEEYVSYTENEDNWEMYTLPVGVHELDGYMALWYARYRKGTSDFDRTMRQHQVLRAILARAKSLGLLDVTRIDELWREYGDLVETDMGLGNFFQLAPVAANLDAIEITSYFLYEGIIFWHDPVLQQDVFLPDPDAVPHIVSLAMQPPAQNYVTANTASVEVRNGTPYERLDEVAADRLGWAGLTATPTGFAPDSTNYTETVIYDYTGRNKASQLFTLQRILRIGDDRVIVQPDPNRVFDYVVILGQDYKSCTRNTGNS